MRILLTNDDGIYAEGLLAVYNELSKIASVDVVAPDSERSSVGHGITLAHPIWIKKVKRNNRSLGYGISGTPADCVKLAVGVLLKKKPDIVISGINLGPNDGCSAFYSGTVAGAREGAMIGIPSMAVSLGTFTNPDFSYAARISAKIAKIIFRRKLPNGTFLNVNVPNVKTARMKGIRITRQGKVPIHGYFEKRTDPNFRDYYWMSGKVLGVEKDIDTDTYALERNYVTVTPIQSDITDFEFMKTLKKWKL